MNLIELLGKFKAGETSEKTHTVIPNLNNAEYKFGATYSIPQDLVKESSSLFYDYFFQNQGTLSVTEKVPDICPLYIDLDLEFDGTQTNRQFNESTIDTLVSFLNQSIRENVVYEKDLECYVQVKPNSKRNEGGFVIKEGIHVVYPNLIGDRLSWNQLFRYMSEQPLDTLFSSFLTKPVNDPHKIFDTNVKRWFVYGSAKPNGDPYKVKYRFKNETRIDSKLTDKEFVELFYLTKQFEKNVTYTNKDMEPVKPVVSEISVLNDDYEYTDHDLDSEEECILEDIQNTMKQDEIDFFKKLVTRCYSQDRYDDYDQWLKVGMGLKNTNPGLFDVFDTFSQQSSSYQSREECLKKWNSFQHCSNPITKATLIYWAKLDNENEFHKIKEESLSELVDRSVKEGGAHDDIAKIVYRRYQDEFVCADLKSNIWYNFDGTKWEKCPQGYLLQMKLPVRIKIMYSISQGRFREQQNKRLLNGEPESEDIKKWEETSGKIYNKLKDVPFQKNIMEACRTKFFNPKFQEELDSNTKLLCFENCVYDLNENILREGRPEDKLSITTKYKMPIDKNEFPLSVKEMWKRIEFRSGIDDCDWEKTRRPSLHFVKTYRGIKDFLEKVLPDLQDIEEKPGEIREYCLKYMACRLCGEVMNRFSIWTGSGGNGKSILIDLLRQAMGGYCMNLPVTILTQKRKSSNAACPEKARTRGARLCYMQEPDENETINAGEMKELSGGDMILARNLYQEPFEFKPQFELVLMCNDKPKIEDKTNGAWRRVAVSPFNSRFVDRLEEIDESKHIYKADKTLSEKVKGWGVVFMGMLLRIWSEMDCLDIEVPKSIRMETQNYKNQNDYIGQWFQECTVAEPNETCPFKELCSCYQTWLDNVYGKNIRVDISALKERLVKWQRDKYGFSDGINGTITNPKINIQVKDED